MLKYQAASNLWDFGAKILLNNCDELDTYQSYKVVGFAFDDTWIT